MLKKIFLCIAVASIFIFTAYTVYDSKITLRVSPDQYVNLLEDAYTNIDKYIGMHIELSGYVYIEPGFQENHFVIAQNIFLNELSINEPVIVGFLCENTTKHKLVPNDIVKIKGKIKKSVYNDLEYPVISVYRLHFPLSNQIIL